MRNFYFLFMAVLLIGCASEKPKISDESRQTDQPINYKNVRQKPADEQRQLQANLAKLWPVNVNTTQDKPNHSLNGQPLVTSTTKTQNNNKDYCQKISGMTVSLAKGNPQQTIKSESEKKVVELEAEQVKLLRKLLEFCPISDSMTVSDKLAQAKLLSRLEAQIEERIANYQKRPTKRFFGVDAIASEDMMYVEQWRRKVEQVGTLHYPSEARGKIYGSSVVTVQLRKNGEIAEINIEKPSGHAVLDNAIRKILYLAAPFPAIPDNVMRGNDLFVITQSWSFINDKVEKKEGVND